MLRTPAALAAILIMLSSPNVWAMGPPPSFSGLRGLQGVCVVGSSSEIKALSNVEIDTAVRVRLLSAGLPVSEPCPGTAKSAMLFTDVKAIRSEASNVNAFQVKLELAQDARLLRDPTIEPTLTLTWWDSSIGFATDATMAVEVRKHLETLVDEFAEEFLGENPRQ